MARSQLTIDNAVAAELAGSEDAVLKEAGLIRGEIDGPRSCYCIDETNMQELRERIEQLFSSLQTCCRKGDE